jgi:hypothetical protein
VDLLGERTIMKKYQVGLVCLILVTSVLVFGCRRSKSRWKGTVEQVDGVTIVTNPKEPLFNEGENAFALSRDPSFGVKEGPAEYMFSQIQDLDVDAEGDVYVLDQREAQVKVFNAQGTYLRTIGRRGQGPGEVQMPVFVQITKQRELVVYDYASSRAIFYAPDGTFLRQRSTRKPMMPIGMDPRGYFAGYEILAPPPIGGKVLVVYDPDFQNVKVIAQDEQGQPKVFDIVKPTVYGCMTPNGEVVWGSSETYALIFVNLAGKIVKTIRRDYDPVPITAAARKEFEERYAEPLRHGMSIKFRKNYPAFSGIFADEDGRVFVKTYEGTGGEADRSRLDIYSPEGRFLAQAAVKADIDERSAWKDGYLYTIEMDGSEYPTVVRYRVTWTAR